MKTWLLALAAALVFSSCLPPPFNLEISQGAATASRMTRDNPTLLVFGQGVDPSEHDLAFFPAVRTLSMGGGMDYSGGVILSARSFEYAMRPVSVDSSGVMTNYSMYSQAISNPDPHFPAAVGWPVQPMSGPTGNSYFLVSLFDSVDPQGLNWYMEKVGNTTSQTFYDVDTQKMHDRANNDFASIDSVVVGASVAPDVSGSHDLVHWLAWDVNTPGYYLEMRYQVAESGVTGPSTPRSSLPYDLSGFLPVVPPANFARCAYFYDENQAGDPSRAPNRSFASWWDDSTGGWVCYAWDDLASHQKLPVDHRIDALLTTGKLLSTEGGTGRLYDRDGNLLATFPLGNLAFIGEHYVGGAPRCYFSQALVYQKTLHFNVYWIATDQLATLGG
ncbi:MAG TPA: hypothetical protein VMF68_02525 [Spirochaetia bacterium]|nr:hypothetical protein [Spirochaetia bacterium]